MRIVVRNEFGRRLWHKSFIIFPRKIGNTWVFLETVERRQVKETETRLIPSNDAMTEEVTVYRWEYRFPEKKGNMA